MDEKKQKRSMENRPGDAPPGEPRPREVGPNPGAKARGELATPERPAGETEELLRKNVEETASRRKAEEGGEES
jgi:hypothetical protein